MRAPTWGALARVAFGLALAAGCSGSNNTPSDGDAAADAGDAPVAEGGIDARPDASRVDTGADVVDGPDAPREGGADADALTDATPRPEAGMDASDASDTGDAPGAGDANDSGDVAPVACTLVAPTLTLTSGPVTGTLQGTSVNSLVSCQQLTATAGPEAFFKLKIDALTIVELSVESPADTLLAVRAGCGDQGTEIACADRPLDQTPPGTAGTFGGFAGSGGPFFDAGASGAAGVGGAGGAAVDASSDTPISSMRTSGMRVRLQPGMYTVLVDTLFEAGAVPFTLTARAATPAANASCQTPEVVQASTAPRRGRLDLAGTAQVGCSGTTISALYYAVGVPSGQRLTARVQPLGGDHAWMPRIEATATCGQGACLAQGHSASGATQQLDWVNNSASWRLVTVAVSADSLVNGAQFDLAIGVSDLFATCSRPTPVKDGSTLFNQDITAAPAPGMQTCGPFSDHAFYYSATLLPQQKVAVVAVGSATQSPFASPVSISMRTSCDFNSCVTTNGDGTFQNASDETVTVLIEASPSGNNFDPRFDMRVSIPAPPAGFRIVPPSGLVTTEGGQTATFTVALTSPPTKPVSVALTSDTPAEGTVSPASLQFDDTNWSQPQTVTVKGVDDALGDGARRYKIVTGAAVSTDPRYSGLDTADVEVTNLDDDPGLFIAGADSLVTTEAGGQAVFTVRLNSKPTDTVRVPLSTSDASEGAVSPAELTFGPADWNTPRTVTITGVDDVATDGPQAYTIVTGALVSNDARYAGLNPADVPVHNRDDDFQPIGAKLLTAEICSFPNRGGLTIDDFGTLYVTLSCNAKLMVIASADGGATFGAPVTIPNSSDFGGEFTLAGGQGGVVFLAYEVPGVGLMLTRSSDAGQTWSDRKILMATAGNLRLSTAGKTVVAVATSVNGASGIFVRSTDGGRTFFAPQLIDSFAQEVSVQADGQTVWMPELQTNGRLRNSMDAGATFQTVGTIDITFGPAAIGSRSIFVAGGPTVQIINLADPTQINGVSNPSSSGSSLAVTIDDAETATVLDNTQDGAHTNAVRVTANGTISTAKVVGPRGDFAAAVPLSRKAVAIVLFTGGLPLFTTATWP